MSYSEEDQVGLMGLEFRQVVSARNGNPIVVAHQCCQHQFCLHQIERAVHNHVLAAGKHVQAIVASKHDRGGGIEL